MAIPLISGQLPIEKKQIKVIAFFDKHFPFNLYFDTDLELLSNESPDVLILGGDALNMDPFNHWNTKKPRKYKEMPQPKSYYDFANREFFKNIREAVGKKCKIYYIKGNHEGWADKAVDMIPEGQGYFEVENNIQYVDAFVPQGLGIGLGKLWFYHGDFDKYYASKHTEQLLRRFQRSMMFGHYHDFQVVTIPTPTDVDPIIGYSVPCGTIVNPTSYGRDMPHDRTTGFGSAIIRQDGSFFAQVTEIKNGEFYFHGRHYKSRQLEPRQLRYEM